MPLTRLKALPPDYIEYEPTLKNSGDLEAATKTITATSKPATADYTYSFSIPKPDDDRVNVQRYAVRFQITIDSITSPTTTLYMEIKEKNTDTLIASVTYATTGTKQNAFHYTSGSLFDRLKAGGTCEIEFRFWVDANATGGAVLSQVQFWACVGCKSAGPADLYKVLEIKHTGWIQFGCDAYGVGSTESHAWLTSRKDETVGSWPNYSAFLSEPGQTYETMFCMGSRKWVHKKVELWMRGTVGTGINYIWVLRVFLWST